MNNVLVAGASGFIGRATIEELCCLGHVFEIGRRASDLLPPENFQQVDFLGKPHFSKIPDCIDTIIYLAQHPQYSNLSEDAQKTLEVNTLVPVVLAQRGVELGISNFIYASSGSIYKPSTALIKEDTKELNLSNIYNCSKVSAEVSLSCFEQYFNVTRLRIFYPYGPGQTGRLISNFVDRIRSKAKVQIHGSKKGAIVSPLLKNDLARLIRSIVISPISGPLNVGGDELIDTVSLCELIGDKLGIKPEFEFIRDTDPMPLNPDLKRIKTHVENFKFTSIERGIETVLENLN